MELNWLYRRFGDEFGPVSFDTLQELRQSGQLDDDDLVRKTSENDWRMAATLPAVEPSTDLDLDLDVAKLLAAAENASARQIRDQNSHLDQILSGSRRNFAPGAAARPVVEEVVATWYYRSLGQVLGPFSFDALKEMASGGLLNSCDDVREGQDGVWLSAKRLPELFPKKADGRGSSAEINTVEPEKPEWVCRIDGKERDPMTLSELKKFARLGELDRKDMVRRVWAAAWVHAQDVAGLQFPAPVAAVVATAPSPSSGAPTSTELAAQKRSGDSVEALRPTSEPASRPAWSGTSSPDASSAGLSPARGYVPPSAPASPPPAYRPAPPPPVARSRSSGPSFSFSLPPQVGELLRNPKLYASIGACLLVGALIFGVTFVGGAPGAKEFAQIQEIWTEVDGAMKSGAPDAALKAIADKHMTAVKDLRKRIEPRASAQNRLAQIVLYCTRDHLPKILGNNGDRTKQYERMKADIQEANELYQRMNG